MKTKTSLGNSALVALTILTLSSAALFASNKPKPTEERGIIKSVDAKSHQIVVADEKTKTDKTFQWNDQTKFAEHGKTANASSLQPGRGANFKYVQGAGTPTLKAVKLSPANAQAHSHATSRPHASAKS